MTGDPKITHGQGPEPSKPTLLSSFDLRRRAQWDGNNLFFRGRHVASLIPDGCYPAMWHVVTPDGQVSEMVNFVRARDAAIYLAVKYV